MATKLGEHRNNWFVLRVALRTAAYRNRKHRLVDIVVIAVCGMVCGSDGPTAIHRWAADRREWLENFLALPNGFPSRDCIRRLFMALKPEAFQMLSGLDRPCDRDRR